MTSIILYDCEFLTAPGASGRHWCGPTDPDPQVVQIGAIRLDLSARQIVQERDWIIRPLDRRGAPCVLDPHFTQLTGITARRVETEGQPLAQVLGALAEFAAQDGLWSWGKDECNTLAQSSFIAGCPMPLPAWRFGNLTQMMLHAGMPLEDIHKTRSNALAAYFGCAAPDARAHDGLDDARSLARAVLHVLAKGRLSPQDFHLPPPN